FYFGAFWKPGAFDTFAASYDLVHWTKWGGAPLVKSSEPYDETFAHKPWLLKHDGVVYHLYCAVGDQGRVIALATSRDLRAAAAPATRAGSTRWRLRAICGRRRRRLRRIRRRGDEIYRSKRWKTKSIR